MIVAVDTNIIIDVLVNDSTNCVSSEKILQKYAHTKCVISPVVYSELLVQFLRRFDHPKAIVELDEFLKSLALQVLPFEQEDYQLAASVWKRWLEKKQQAVACSVCGHSNVISCKKCGNTLRLKQHMIADFLIGAHATRHASVLLTRDRGFYHLFDVTIEP